MKASSKHPRVVAAISALGALLVTAACGGGDAPPESQTETRFLSVSWATSYASVEDLTNAADIIVLGAAESVASTNTDEFTAGQQRQSLTFTNFAVSIEEVLKGAPGASEVLVHQTGGVLDDGTTVEIEDAPLLEVGTRYLLFLQADPNSDTFAILGGPDGRLIEQGGELSSLSAMYPDRNIRDLGLSGESLDAVRQEVSAIAAE